MPILKRPRASEIVTGTLTASASSCFLGNLFAPSDNLSYPPLKVYHYHYLKMMNLVDV